MGKGERERGEEREGGGENGKGREREGGRVKAKQRCRDGVMSDFVPWCTGKRGGMEGEKEQTQVAASSRRDILVTPGRMVPLIGGVAISGSKYSNSDVILMMSLLL